MRLLVTGGSGFIGSNFIRLILSKYPGYSVINLDKLTYAGNPDNLKDAESNRNYKFVKGDICDSKIVRDLMKKTDAVVHFAAETHVDRSIMDAGTFIQTDVYGTFVLLNEARKSNISKFIHISTDEVYGSIEKGSFTEESSLNPTNPYSASKAGADRLAYSYFKTFNLPVCISRSSNNFGPYQHPEKFIPLFITNAIENKPLPLYGDGKNRRDWIYSPDNCRAIDLLLHKGKIGEVYNIGGGNEMENIEIAKMIIKELGKNEDMINLVRDRPGHDKRYSLNSRKIGHLGFKPGRDFKSALKETIRWYTKNTQWWKKIKSGEYRRYYGRQYKAD
ncbi:dTDP-glucose 4,6-dehydratase [Candidatus Woesearchaeota archaeon]|nr:dTDP-glucose 4,6-dehydratase [Candidatus Woesearchaeota archaeon]